MTNITGIDGTSAEDLTTAEVEGRRQIRILLDFLRARISGYERSYLVETAPMMGVRETRRILGEYVLSEDDVLNEAKFQDSVAQSSYGTDIHNPKDPGTFLRVVKSGGSHGIPYRCLIPRKTEAIITTGRCISATHEANSAIRVMATCMATGQAAGTAAALSLKKSVSPRELDVKLLQETERSQGVIL